MRSTDVFSEWYSYASSDQYYLIVASGTVMGEPEQLLDRKILEKLGLDSDYQEQLRVLTGEHVIRSNKDGAEKSMEFRELGTMLLGGTISIEDGSCTFRLGDKEWRGDPTCINVFVVNAYNGVLEDHRLIRFEPGAQTILFQGSIH